MFHYKQGTVVGGYEIGPILKKDVVYEMRLSKPIKAKGTNKDVVVIKIVSKEYNLAKNEIKAVKSLKHEHIIPNFGSTEDDEYYFHTIPFCSGGNLYDYITYKKKNLISELEAKAIMLQITSAVLHAKQNGWCNRDLRLDNIMLRDKNDEIPHCYISDWGSCTPYDKNKFELDYVGSSSYSAPEIILRRPYKAYELDVWALGCILYALLAGKLPFTSDEPSIKAELIIKGLYYKPADASNDANDLLSKMLDINPASRIIIERILTHPWFYDVTNMEKLPPVEGKQSVTQYFRNEFRKSVQITGDRENKVASKLSASQGKKRLPKKFSFWKF